MLKRSTFFAIVLSLLIVTPSLAQDTAEQDYTAEIESDLIDPEPEMDSATDKTSGEATDEATTPKKKPKQDAKPQKAEVARKASKKKHTH